MCPPLNDSRVVYNPRDASFPSQLTPSDATFRNQSCYSNLNLTFLFSFTLLIPRQVLPELLLIMTWFNIPCLHYTDFLRKKTWASYINRWEKNHPEFYHPKQPLFIFHILLIYLCICVCIKTRTEKYIIRVLNHSVMGIVASYFCHSTSD